MLLLVLLSACDECQRGDMLASEEGLVVTEAEHPDGWGRSDCAGCHAFEALHRTSCAEGVDLESIRARVDEEGDAACAACHGDNGVEEGG